MASARRLGLVLGGGGIAGIAWHTGVLRGLALGGADVTSADRLIGTSAGATVAAQLGSGCSLDGLYERQVDPTSLATELAPGLSVTELWELMLPIYTESVDDDERRRRLGRLALDALTVGEEVRRRVIAARLGDIDWRGGRVSVVACEAVTGQRRVFDRASDVAVIDAVAASCAVPGVWPPVTINGCRHIDGGVWSLTNVDLATGCDLVIVLAPLSDQAMHDQLAGLGNGVESVVITPDEASIAAFGPDVLDLTVRGQSARAGMAQGRREAERMVGVLAG